MIVMREKEEIMKGLSTINDLSGAGWVALVEAVCDIRDALVRHNEREDEDLGWRKEKTAEERVMQEALLRDNQQLVATQGAMARTLGAEPPSPSDIESMMDDIDDDEESDGQGEEEETEGPAGD